MQPEASISRCSWCGSHDDYIAYHDDEWGVPVTNDVKLFELLTLEGAQAGLSWLTILRKREGYRNAFAQFDPVKVSRFSESRIAKLREDPGIVRNRLKIQSTVGNAQAFLKIVNQYGSFASFIWRYVDGVPVQNAFRSIKDMPAQTPLAQRISKDLKKAGFKFVGPTIVYAFMQSAGMVNDHVATCFRHAEVARYAAKPVV